MKFMPNYSGTLSLEICISPDNETIFADSIAAAVDTVRMGLPREYSQGVMDGMIQSLNLPLAETFGAGVIVVDQAAYGEISSSPNFFRKIARMVIQLLLLPPMIDENTIQDMINTESRLSLNTPILE